jgi:hypothetical protein
MHAWAIGSERAVHRSASARAIERQTERGVYGTATTIEDGAGR